MCGRYKQTSPFAMLAEVFGIRDVPGFQPAGIVAPGMKAPVITNPAGRDGGITYMTWGFVPHWSKEDLKTKIINARLETLHEKPSFRDAKRCVIPANGFFEWDRSGKPSRPFDFHLAENAPFALAGLFDEWTNPATGEVRETFAIVTTAASPVVAKIHDRMPVILRTPEAMAAWINMEKNFREPGDSIPLLATPVSRAANEDKVPENAQLALF
ncbi:MAG: SOS response-associated peptidase [Alphaproteobacteria bacterium]|nr:MAG: SOS response-associated peptidase [Alphaproteobacteria bacterium]